MLQIKGYNILSTIDYPDNPCSIIFTQGCNLACPWCHNKEMIPITDGEISPEKVLKVLYKYKFFIHHVCISGGEPTIQGEDLLDFIKTLNLMKFKVKLDTNGTNSKLLKKLLKYLDYVAIDYKGYFYKNILDSVHESLKILDHSDIKYEIRTTCDPRTVDETIIINMAYDLKEYKNFDRWVLQEVRPREKSIIIISELKKLVENIIPNVEVRNET